MTMFIMCPREFARPQRLIFPSGEYVDSLSVFVNHDLMCDFKSLITVFGRYFLI